METLLTQFSPLIAKTLTAAFLAILFLQSGFDKIVDFKGNLEWLSGHFSKSPLRGTVKPMLIAIAILEVIAGAFCGIGVLQIVFLSKSTLALGGAILAAISITCLFFGQRVAKDYAGAAVLVPYFLLCLVAIRVLGVAF